MPSRVPPPPASNAFEQYVIDALLHLDDCLDEHKTDTKAAFTELKAEVAANAVISREKAKTLTELIDEHAAFHKTMDIQAKAKRSVWRMQAAILGDIVRYTKEILALGAGALILKLLGFL